MVRKEDMAIDHVALTVRDLPAMADFYERAPGLVPQGGDDASRSLGTDGRTLVELRHDAAARPRDPQMTGLAEIVLNAPDRAGQVLHHEPWGTRFAMI